MFLAYSLEACPNSLCLRAALGSILGHTPSYGPSLTGQVFKHYSHLSLPRTLTFALTISPQPLPLPFPPLVSSFFILSPPMGKNFPDSPDAPRHKL